jgi:multicomponent Na+:H+ antiporter subunit G
MTIPEVISMVLILGGCGFFLVGTIGLLRFPDVFTVLHALSKSDNLGLGLVVMGLLPYADTWADGAKLLIIWLLAMGSGSTTSHLIARKLLRTGVQPWQR